MSVTDDMAALAAAVMDGHGRIDIFVNNAGITHLPTPMDEIEEAEFDRVLMVNAKSVYLSARHVVPVMKRGYRCHSEYRINGGRVAATRSQLVNAARGG